PYVIGCTPANDKAWGIYEAGGKNGLVVSGTAGAAVAVSVDGGKTWAEGGSLPAEQPVDWTDHVKGNNQYLLRVGAPAEKLKGSGLTIRTVCQMNVATIPHLNDG